MANVKGQIISYQEVGTVSKNTQKVLLIEIFGVSNEKYNLLGIALAQSPLYAVSCPIAGYFYSGVTKIKEEKSQIFEFSRPCT